MIIETQNKSKVGGRGNIKPGNNTKFEFEEMETHELNYYNEYHLETMKGILTMSETRQ